VKSWLAILLMVVTVCAQAVAAVSPLPAKTPGRVCGCCDCRSLSCCAAPATPEPTTPSPAATATTLQKSVPVATTATVAWFLPTKSISEKSFAIAFSFPSTESLHQRLCVLLI